MRPVPAPILSALTGTLCLVLAWPSVGAPLTAASRSLPFPVVPLEKLAKQRGGFVGAEGMRLQLNLNLRQMVVVNDKVVSDIRTNLNEMMQELQGDTNALRQRLQEERDALRSNLAELKRSLDETTGNLEKTGSEGTGSHTDIVGTTKTGSSSLDNGKLGTSSGEGGGSARNTTTFETEVGLRNKDESLTKGDTGKAGDALTSGQTKVTVLTPADSNPASSSQSRDKVVVVQNGPGNQFDPTGVRDIRGGTLTIIQNSLNNQLIQHRLSVDVTLSGLRNLRTMNLLGGLNLQLRGSGR